MGIINYVTIYKLCIIPIYEIFTFISWYCLWSIFNLHNFDTDDNLLYAGIVLSIITLSFLNYIKLIINEKQYLIKEEKLLNQLKICMQNSNNKVNHKMRLIRHS